MRDLKPKDVIVITAFGADPPDNADELVELGYRYTVDFITGDGTIHIYPHGRDYIEDWDVDFIEPGLGDQYALWEPVIYEDPL